jgi:hypothetical protein
MTVNIAFTFFTRLVSLKANGNFRRTQLLNMKKKVTCGQDLLLIMKEKLVLDLKQEMHKMTIKYPSH